MKFKFLGNKKRLAVVLGVFTLFVAGGISYRYFGLGKFLADTRGTSSIVQQKTVGTWNTRTLSQSQAVNLSYDNTALKLASFSQQSEGWNGGESMNTATTNEIGSRVTLEPTFNATGSYDPEQNITFMLYLVGKGTLTPSNLNTPDVLGPDHVIVSLVYNDQTANPTFLKFDGHETWTTDGPIKLGDIINKKIKWEVAFKAPNTPNANFLASYCYYFPFSGQWYYQNGSAKVTANSGNPNLPVKWNKLRLSRQATVPNGTAVEARICNTQDQNSCIQLSLGDNKQDFNFPASGFLAQSVNIELLLSRSIGAMATPTVTGDLSVGALFAPVITGKVKEQASKSIVPNTPIMAAPLSYDTGFQNPEYSENNWNNVAKETCTFTSTTKSDGSFIIFLSAPDSARCVNYIIFIGGEDYLRWTTVRVDVNSAQKVYNVGDFLVRTADALINIKIPLTTMNNTSTINLQSGDQMDIYFDGVKRSGDASRNSDGTWSYMESWDNKSHSVKAVYKPRSDISGLELEPIDSNTINFTYSRPYNNIQLTFDKHWVYGSLAGYKVGNYPTKVIFRKGSGTYASDFEQNSPVPEFSAGTTPYYKMLIPFFPDREETVRGKSRTIKTLWSVYAYNINPSSGNNLSYAWGVSGDRYGVDDKQYQSADMRSRANINLNIGSVTINVIFSPVNQPIATGAYVKFFRIKNGSRVETRFGTNMGGGRFAIKDLPFSLGGIGDGNYEILVSKTGMVMDRVEIAGRRLENNIFFPGNDGINAVINVYMRLK